LAGMAGMRFSRLRMTGLEPALGRWATVCLAKPGAFRVAAVAAAMGVAAVDGSSEPLMSFCYWQFATREVNHVYRSMA
jgi:hypothetical protein